MQSERLKRLPPYLFAEIDAKKRAMREKGVDIIDLSIGDPDIPTPKHVIEAFCEGAHDARNHRYPPYNGTQEFREAAVSYLKETKGVDLDPNSEALTLIGSKEGIAHAPLAFLDPGDVVLIPSPGYPVYTTASLLSGCVPYEMPLKKENGFLPDLGSIPKDVLKKAKLIFLNYPNNPTAAVATKDFFKDAVDFAKGNGLVLCHDAAYIDIVYDGYKAPSILEVPGAKDVAVEFYSLSKTYNMTGWRLGFAAGNKGLIESLGKLKTNIDSSATAAVQHGGAVAMTSSQDCVVNACKTYKNRRDVLVQALNKKGWNVVKPKATFYVWVEIPTKEDSRSFASKILEKTGVVVTPGLGFGSAGEGFIRFSVSYPTERIEEAVHRISSL